MTDNLIVSIVRVRRTRVLNLATPGTLNVTGVSTLTATNMISNNVSGNEVITRNLNVAGTTNLAATTFSGLTLTGLVTGTPLNSVYNGHH